MPVGFRPREDASGKVYLFSGFDTSIAPSGHLPAGGHFFDVIVRPEPIDEDNLNPADNGEAFTLREPAAIAHWQREFARVRGETRAVVSGIGGTGFGDITLVPAPFLQHPKGIRDVSEWYSKLFKRPDSAHRVFADQCDIALKTGPPSPRARATPSTS